MPTQTDSSVANVRVHTDQGSPVQRYVAAYDRVRARRVAEAETARLAEERRIAEEHDRLRAQLDAFIPAEVLRDWRVHFPDDPYHDAPEIELVPWFVVGARLRVHMGTGFWYGREAIKVIPQRSCVGQSYWVEKGMSVAEVEEVLAAALWDGQERES